MSMIFDPDYVYLGTQPYTDTYSRIHRSDRRRHLHIIGQTGTGKTTLAHSMILQDIWAGHGVCVIDPHGDLADDLLTHIPRNRRNDVVYFNPFDFDYPIGFNVLSGADPENRHLIVSDLMGIFTKVWANAWSARMEYVLQNCLSALVDVPGATLLGVNRLLTDRHYREQVIPQITDPIVRSFWTDEFAAWRDQYKTEAIAPIQNKVNQLLNVGFMRNILAQSHSKLDLETIMNEGKILLVNLSKGDLGEDNARLLGAMFVTKLYLAALRRRRIPEQDRRDFFLFVDEFQNFVTDSFADILSEARKFRLNLTILHQYVGQLTSELSVKVHDAVFGTVGSRIAFRVGQLDTDKLHRDYQGFHPHDFTNLPNFWAITKLIEHDHPGTPRTIKIFTPPTAPPQGERIKEKIIRESRSRYATPRRIVEDKITRWLGVTDG